MTDLTSGADHNGRRTPPASTTSTTSAERPGLRRSIRVRTRVGRRGLPLTLAALLGLILMLVGCATIPTQTDPLPLPAGGGQGTTALVPQPPKANPLDLVRDWVHDAGNPVDKHAAARAYLANSSKAGWNDAAFSGSARVGR